MSAVLGRWYWVHNGRQGGPVTWDELQTLAKRGSLRADDLVLREGTQQWKPAATARADEPTAGATSGVAQPLPPAIPLPQQAAAVATASPTIIEDATDDAPLPQRSGNRGMQRMMIGTALFLAGIFLTYISYEASQSFLGGRFIVFRGLIIFGIIQFIRGIAEAGSDG
jgi:hypothetical protein